LVCGQVTLADRIHTGDDPGGSADGYCARLALFQRFNVISVAFIPLFVGMGMDLGIQFSVRYRAERGAGGDVAKALTATASTLGKSLTLAAAAIGAAFSPLHPQRTTECRNSG